MRKWFYRLAVSTCLAAAFFAPLGARAQGNITLESVSVLLWPEFDKPAMLVMAEIVLSVEVPLPQDISFRIPAAGTIHTVAIGQTQDAVSDQGIVYDVASSGEWATVSIANVSAPAIRIEYYDVLEKQGTARHYLYTWPGDYEVGAFAVQFQSPFDASGLAFTPALTGSTVGSDGLTYYSAAFGALAGGEAFTLAVDYQKTSDTLSASRINAQPAENPEAASGRVTWTNYVPWLLGILGLALVLLGLVAGVSYWQGRGRRAGGSGRARHAARRESAGAPAAAVYCHQCGRRAQPGDLFCRACGTRLRRGEQ
jgi:hypothetical protein